MLTLAPLFATILAGLRAAIGPYTMREPQRASILALAWTRIGRAAQRLAALLASWQAGTLPQPRPARPPRPTRPTPPRPNFPTSHGWLAASRHEICGRASQLQHLFAHPDMPAFLAAAPQAGRILRPLCHMLAIPLPAPLALPPRFLPPRPRKPRPSRAKPAAPPSTTPDRPLPAYIRAAVRAWRKKPA